MRREARTSRTDGDGGGAPLVELRGITKVYGSGPAAMHALRGVDLTIRSGEFVAVMGPSGSGKSTCMNIVGCLDTPTAGSYRFRGMEVTELSRRERSLLRRFWFGFVFQGFNLLPRTSAVENVELPLMYRGSPPAERRRAALAALAEVGLTGWETHTPAELSGGQQQRVAIARAIVSRPALLLADEPTGNLDTARSLEIMELLERFNREHGITIVMVTHEAEMAACARRVVRFVDGLVSTDTVEDAPRASLAEDAPRASLAGDARGADVATATALRTDAPAATGGARVA